MKVAAVIVTYRPTLTVLREIMRILSNQCDIIVADNAATPDEAHLVAAQVGNAGHVTYLSMQGNLGIGAAQNAGIAAAWARGAEAVLLLDDDSIPAADLVECLVRCARTLGPQAVVSANAIAPDGKEISNIRNAVGALPHCRDMMSSGALIRRSIFERVGRFDEDLFIDGVDFDWGWRARQLGFDLRLCRSTAIRHRLGDGSVAGVRYPSPIRHYFQYRNVLRLMLRPHTPSDWRIAQSFKLAAKLALIPLLMPQRMVRLRFAVSGIRDALLGVGGPYVATPRGKR
ncbi:glycosyltransferase [Sphingomonas sp. KR1UV-12]|uniref:Glycosyltransferase n=1 Tax=Sphingomonas aurea TaxID=3063994 RepID=A0ABT9EPC0_9SPHN|nr:glycosyltransferase [Sphingomonas sp. KR1UV-12]MDP1028815.1 glycosyltransferase [Sphingomonas sp. KR1UV-12]